MNCPKCGFQQPTGPECMDCGLIFSKFKTEEMRQQHMTPPISEAPRAPEPTAVEFGAPDPLQMPIRPLLRVVRTFAGVMAIMFGIWLFFIGESYNLEPYHVLLLIAYACVGLFWVMSTPLKVSVKQFAIEMLVFVFATVLLKVALPEVFELGKLSNRESGPLIGDSGSSSEQKALTEKDFAAKVEDLLEEAREVLDDPSDKKLTEAWLERSATTRKLFRKMSKDERKKAEALYKGAVALEEKMEGVIVTAGKRGVDDAFNALEDLDRVVVSVLK